MYNVDHISMFPTKEWKADLSNKKKDEATGRDVVSIYVGDRINAANERSPVLEDFYLDEIQSIIAEPKKYQIFTSAGSIPQLCVMSGGRIIDHNYQMHLLKMAYHNILNGISKESMCNALTESCMPNNKSSDTKAIRSIQHKFSGITGMYVSNRFVKALVIEHFRADYSEEIESPLADRLSGYSLKELKNIANEINQCHWNVNAKKNQIEKLKETFNANPKDIEEALKEELYLRLLLGKLKEGK